jgi:hypothetical protein
LKGERKMKKTLNPFENAKRIANGAGGGVSPTVIEEMQEEITILGSQNTQQAQDLTDIKAQLTELAGAYSTTEHKTGRKWIDGSDIYEQTLDVKELMTNGQNSTIDFVCNKMLNVKGYAKSPTDCITIPYISGDGNSIISVYYDNTANKLHVHCKTNLTSYNGEAYVTVEYIKTGA